MWNASLTRIKKHNYRIVNTGNIDNLEMESYVGEIVKKAVLLGSFMEILEWDLTN